MPDVTIVSTNRAAWLYAWVYFAWLIVAWCAAWLLLLRIEQDFDLPAAWEFGYWTILKLLIWVAPAIALIHVSGRTFLYSLGLMRPTSMLGWGASVGLVLAAVNIIANRRALALPVLSWPLINAMLVAPVVEEISFRGGILGALLQRFHFPLANTITALMFAAAHMPGWWFQGRLIEMLTAPIGGAISIFMLGWIFGWIVKRSGSVGAGIIAHSLNNLSNA